MMRSGHRDNVKESPLKTAFTIAVCVLTTFTLSILAAPYLPGKMKLGGDVRSLADLNAVRLEAEQFAHLLTEEGLTGRVIKEQAEKQLSEGIEKVKVVEDADAPLLRIEVYGGVESNVPDAIAFLISVKLIQQAHVARTDETLQVPTYTMIRGGIDKLERARRATEREIRTVLETFMTDRNMATQQKRHRSK